MSVRMSKYVCNECHVPLSTKYALERHQNSSRCQKNQRDHAKEKIYEKAELMKAYDSIKIPDVSPALEPKPLCDNAIKHMLKDPVKTIFARTFPDRITTSRKRYHSKEFRDSFTISNDTEGHMLHNLRLHILCGVGDNTLINIRYNGALIFCMPLVALQLLEIDHNDIPIWDMIFGQDFLPLGKIEVSFHDTTHVRCRITYDTYILEPGEAKRRTQIPFEKYFNAWFCTNISNSDDAHLLTTPTNCYIADLYYTDQDAVNPSYQAYRMPWSQHCPYHYNCLPNIPEANANGPWTITSMLFSSLAPPGETLFAKATEDPVIMRYIALLKVEDGKAYAYHHPYHEDPMRVAQRKIAERIQASERGETVPHEKIAPRVDPKSNGYHSIYKYKEMIIPVHWINVPSHCHYNLYEPDWELINCPEAADSLFPKVHLDKLVELCASDSKDFKLINTDDWLLSGPVMTVSGKSIMPSGNYYCFCYKDVWYGLSDLDIEMYVKYHVPMNPELKEALTCALALAHAQVTAD